VKKIKTIFILFLVIFIGTGCSHKEKRDASSKPIIAVTTFALYDITKHLVGDDVEVVHILPFGVDPHSFEPTPKLMAKIEKANIVFYSGAGLEPWTHSFHFSHKAINVSEYVSLRHLNALEAQEHHNSIDPHYWLDFANMKKMVHLIATELIQLLPQDKVVFQYNELQYIKMLDTLDQVYKQKLSQCQLDTVVISHNALGYLSDKYHFKVESLSGLSPEAQPSAKDIAKIMEDIKKRHVSTAFFEHFVNDSIVKSVAHDTGIQLEVFQPLGNITADEANAGLTYEDIMYKNVDKLAKALMCK